MQRIKKTLIWLAIVSNIIIFSAAESICGELRIDDFVWDGNLQSFKMNLSTPAGKIPTDKLKAYRIKVEIGISRGLRTKSYMVHGEKTVDAVTRTGTRSAIIYRIGALNIPWDRDGGSLTGAVRATVKILLMDLNGVVVDKASDVKTIRVQ